MFILPMGLNIRNSNPVTDIVTIKGNLLISLLRGLIHSWRKVGSIEHDLFILLIFKHIHSIAYYTHFYISYLYFQ